MMEECHTEFLPYWTYLQICSYLTTHQTRKLVNRPLMAFESLCLKDERVEKVTFLSYSWLQQGTDKRVDSFKEQLASLLSTVWIYKMTIDKGLYFSPQMLAEFEDLGNLLQDFNPMVCYSC